MQEVIRARQLTKSYGKLPAADNISLSVTSGMVFGLLGANGAGKSTTIECILGMKKMDSGQRQRLFIVLALIPNPEVVFLDEMTTGLDAKARREVWKILSDLKEKGLTIFLTSHFMDEVEALCDQICILKKGQIVFHGTVPGAVESSPCDKFEDAYLWYTDEEGVAHENF